MYEFWGDGEYQSYLSQLQYGDVKIHKILPIFFNYYFIDAKSRHKKSPLQKKPQTQLKKPQKPKPPSKTKNPTKNKIQDKINKQKSTCRPNRLNLKLREVN